ncbi:MAG: cyclase family protein [Gemmatimonadaceae bacterium]|nr:cyclase family protein [Gemmatimonadaceae bacterium]
MPTRRLHVAPTGAPSELLPLEAFHGPVTVLDARDAVDGATLTTEWLSVALERHRLPTRLILRTDRGVGSGTFPAAWPCLTPDAATWLARAGLRLLGVDCPSVDARTATTLSVHHALFAGGAYVLENLDLRAVPAGDYMLTAYPVLVAGADAAPVRAILEHDR